MDNELKDVLDIAKDKGELADTKSVIRDFFTDMAHEGGFENPNMVDLSRIQDADVKQQVLMFFIFLKNNEDDVLDNQLEYFAKLDEIFGQVGGKRKRKTRKHRKSRKHTRKHYRPRGKKL